MLCGSALPLSSRAADERDGWMGGKRSSWEGRTPEAWRQWWADRLGIRQAEWGSAGAPRLFYSPEAESSGERFRPWGAARLQRSSRRRRIPAPLPNEDCRVLAYRHVPPCGKGLTNPAGSGAHGASTTRPKRRRHRSGMGYLQLCAGIGWRRRRRRRRPSPAGRKGESGRWQTG